MCVCLTNKLQRVLEIFAVNLQADIKQNKQEDILNQARQDLSQAYNIFSNVLDPELIDIAILNLKVAEKRYDFLIRELKRQQAK